MPCILPSGELSLPPRSALSWHSIIIAILVEEARQSSIPRYSDMAMVDHDEWQLVSVGGL